MCKWNTKQTMTDDVSCAASPPPLQKCCKGVFHSSPIVKETSFFFGAMQAVPEIRSEENDRDCKRQTFKSQGRHMCVLWSRIIPITPVTQKHRKQREKSCPLFHSWDRFIIQAKANFDKQLGTISPNLWVILCNIQSTIKGERKS